MGYQNDGRNRRNFGGQDNSHRGAQGYSHQNYGQEEQYDEYMGQQGFQGDQDYHGNQGHYDQSIGGHRDNRYFESKVQQRPHVNQGGYNAMQGQKSKNYGMQSPDYFEEEGQGQNMRNVQQQGSYRGAGFEGNQGGRGQMSGHHMHQDRNQYGDHSGNHGPASGYQTGGMGYSGYKPAGQGAANTSQSAMKQQPHGNTGLTISEDRETRSR